MNIRMNIYQVTITLVILAETWTAACQPYPNYTAYHDLDNKGEAIFKKDLQRCRNSADQKLTPFEGSEATGERFNRKRSLMRNCMENKQWILKH